MEDTSMYALGIAGIGALGSAIKIYFDYRAKKDALELAEKERQRAHELELLKAKSDAGLRATIVGIERHKQTMTPEQRLLLNQAIQDAALEESAEDLIKHHVNEITKLKGTKFFNPEELRKSLEAEEASNQGDGVSETTQ